MGRVTYFLHRGHVYIFSGTEGKSKKRERKRMQGRSQNKTKQKKNKTKKTGRRGKNPTCHFSSEYYYSKISIFSWDICKRQRVSGEE